MTSPRVSIITPTLNRRHLLGETIDSVQRQDFSGWEHLIVDDGSEDGTDIEVQRRAETDARIRLVGHCGPARGANVCRNIGVRESLGEFIVFLDSDDLLEPWCLGRRVQVMERNADLDFATFQAGMFEHRVGDLKRSPDRQLLGDDLLRFLYFDIPWIISSPIWRREALLRVGLLDESLPSWQDIELHVRAIAAGCRYLRHADIDHHVRWQNEPGKVSIEQRRSPAHLMAAEGLFVKIEQLLREGPGIDWVRQRALCSLYFFVAERWVAIGQPSEALRLWKTVRQRRLASPGFHRAGASLLAIRAAHVPLANRLTHKWKGWTRLRLNPELVPQ